MNEPVDKVTECQWTTKDDVDVNVHHSDFDDCHMFDPVPDVTDSTK